MTSERHTLHHEEVGQNTEVKLNCARCIIMMFGLTKSRSFTLKMSKHCFYGF